MKLSTAVLFGVIAFHGVSIFADSAWDQAKGKWMAQWGKTSGAPGHSQLHIEGSGQAKFPGGEMVFSSAKDRTWEGHWTRSPATESCVEEKHGTYYWGVVKITFDESYEHFDGTWDFCGDGKTNLIKGKRQ